MPQWTLHRVSYGWVVVGGAFVSFTLSLGLMHSYTVFFVAFLEEFGWTRADTSVAYALSQLLLGTSAPLIGYAVDRLGPRILVMIGGVILSVGLLACATISSLWQINLLYGIVMTLGASCLSLVVFVPLVSRWFIRQRGLAIAIVQSANGVGRALATPLVQMLVRAVGWRTSFVLLGLLMAACLVPLLGFFRMREPTPEEAAAAQADTQTAPARPAARVVRNAVDWRLGEAVRTTHFWLLLGVYMFTGLGSFFVSLHQFAFAVDMGFDGLYAATALGVGSLLTIGGIIVFGLLSDYIGRERSAILAYVMSMIGVGWAMLINGAEDAWMLWLHACFFGIAWGARGPMITAKAADLFQGTHLGTILGVITIGTGIGSAVGTWVSGWIFDLFNSYQLSFALSLLSYAGGCATFWLLRRPLAQPDPARQGG